MLKRTMTNLIVLICCLLSGCAVIATVTGASSTTITTVKTVEAVKLGADAASSVATDKTLTDHAISAMTGKDCSTMNVFRKDRHFCEMPKPLMPDISSSDCIKDFQIRCNIHPADGTMNIQTRLKLLRIEHGLDIYESIGLCHPK
jgi:uncharacterized protein YceK